MMAKQREECHACDVVTLRASLPLASLSLTTIMTLSAFINEIEQVKQSREVKIAYVCLKASSEF